MPLKSIVFISIILFIDNSGADASRRDLPEIPKGQQCEEGKIYKKDCNTCVCRYNNIICSKMACIQLDQLNNLRPKPITASVNSKPIQEIHDGDACEEGKMYKKGCNTCVCRNNAILCTQMFCLPQETSNDSGRIREDASGNIRQGTNCEEGEVINKDCHHCVCVNSSFHCTMRNCPKYKWAKKLRQEQETDTVAVTVNPREGSSCEEGEVIKKKCNKCVCINNHFQCTKRDCKKNKQLNSLRLRQKAAKRAKEDIESQLIVSDREFLLLPRLPHHAAECTPNQKYKVDCNVCYCNSNKNLVCDKKMCVDHKTTRDIEARKQSGKPCTENFETKKCIKCKCKNSITECKPMLNCQTSDDQVMLSKGAGSIHRLTFNYTNDQCIPDVVYKEKCNKCYCQPDKTLRCTNKMCLNHEQALQLEEQREYLEEHGL